MTTQQFYYQQMLRENTLRAYAAAMKQYLGAAGDAGDTPTPPPVTEKGLCFTINEIEEGNPENAYVSMAYWSNGSEPHQNTFQCRVNDGEWKTLAFTYDAGSQMWYSDSIYVANVGDKVYFKTSVALDNFSTEEDGYEFISNGINSMSVSGKIMWLMDPTGTATEIPETATSYTFSYLFYAMQSLVDASELILPNNVNYCCYYLMFYYCISLTDAPELPAETLAQYCYSEMFEDCWSLTAAPELPATTLEEGCYNSIFYKCESLTSAPALPATTLAKYCYFDMFYQCVSLTAVPELPATTLAEGCYSEMFQNCTGITDFPDLPATTLAPGCYFSMFYCCQNINDTLALSVTSLEPGCYAYMCGACTSLTNAPTLPATELPNELWYLNGEGYGCYEGMFAYCYSLPQAPELPAETLTQRCYNNMFWQCSGLYSMNVSFTAWNAEDSATNVWVNAVAPSGTFYCPSELSIAYDDSYIPYNWTVIKPVVPEKGLCFTALTDNSTISLSCISNMSHSTEYQASTDGTTWTTYSSAKGSAPTFTINAGNKVYFKSISGSSSSFYSADYQRSGFVMTGRWKMSGKLMWLADSTGESTTIPASSYFKMLFYGPASNTSALIDASEVTLPASITESCYHATFKNCASLSAAPRITSTTLTSFCYYDMFNGCSSLNSISVDFTAWPSSALSSATHYWLSAVASTGTFYCSSALPDTRGVDYIPTGWTKQDI